MGRRVQERGRPEDQTVKRKGKGRRINFLGRFSKFLNTILDGLFPKVLAIGVILFLLCGSEIHYSPRNAISRIEMIDDGIGLYQIVKKYLPFLL